jgi:hypothetical protein
MSSPWTVRLGKVRHDIQRSQHVRGPKKFTSHKQCVGGHYGSQRSVSHRLKSQKRGYLPRKSYS